MCDPVTAMAVGIGASVISTGVSTLGAVQQAQSQQDIHNYQAAVARNNQILAEHQAADAIDRGKIEEGKHREKVKQLIGRQRSIFGSAGLQLDSGTPLDVQLDTAEIGELDSLTIRNNFQRESEAYLIRAQNFGNQAVLNRAAADAINPGLAGATTLLSGVGSVADKYAKFKFYGG